MSEFVNGTKNERNVCVSACEHRTVCMLDGEGSTLHVTDKIHLCARLGWTERRHAVWPYCHDRSSNEIFFNLDLFWFQNLVILKSDSDFGLELTGNVVVWTGLWLGVVLRLNGFMACWLKKQFAFLNIGLNCGRAWIESVFWLSTYLKQKVNKNIIRADILSSVYAKL